MADEVAEGEVLEPRYYQAKFKVAVFNYRKIFGLSFQEVMEEPFDEFIINARINQMISLKDRKEAENNKHG